MSDFKFPDVSHYKSNGVDWSRTCLASSAERLQAQKGAGDPKLKASCEIKPKGQWGANGAMPLESLAPRKQERIEAAIVAVEGKAKRGPKPSGNALTPAERAAAYRAAKKLGATDA